MIVQIAGIRNVDDAVMCAKAGADIIGLLVGQKHNSFEFISKELAREIKLALPKGTKTTLITHLEDCEQIVDIAKFVGVDFVQLHSKIDEKQVEKIKKALPNVKIIRVIHIAKDGTILTDYHKMKIVDFFFTDSINQETNQVGGTGLEHNRETDKFLVETLAKPVFIAGGLNASNVAEAIEFCHPYAVDVNSGCRGADGFRDKAKVEAFIASAKQKS